MRRSLLIFVAAVCAANPNNFCDQYCLDQGDQAGFYSKATDACGCIVWHDYEAVRSHIKFFKKRPKGHASHFEEDTRKEFKYESDDSTNGTTAVWHNYGAGLVE